MVLHDRKGTNEPSMECDIMHNKMWYPICGHIVYNFCVEHENGTKQQ